MEVSARKAMDTIHIQNVYSTYEVEVLCGSII